LFIFDERFAQPLQKYPSVLVSLLSSTWLSVLPVKYINSCLMTWPQVVVTIADCKRAACRFEIVKSTANLYNPAII